MSRQIRIAAIIWSLSILLSRVIGLVREAVIGRVLGGGAEADVYWASFVIPDFLNYLLAAGALSIVFIPIFGGHLANGDEDAAWRAFRVISTPVLLLLALALGALHLAVPSLSAWWFDGFSEAQQADLVALTRIVLPAQAFHVVGGLLSAALQARDRHLLPALAPVVYTSGIIAGGLIAGPTLGAYGFAWGVLAGSIAGPFLLPLIGCLRMGLRWWPSLDLSHPDLRRWLWRSLPIMLAFSVVVVDDWMLKREASRLAEGSVSTVQYAKSLLKVPMGVFGLAAGAAAFPTLTRLIAQGKDADAWEVLTASTRRMLALALGAQVLLSVAGTEIAAVIYGSRLPSTQHADIGAALTIMAIGLWAWAAQTLLARGFYARGDTWVPSLLGSAAMLIAFPVYGALAAPLGTVGLAAASTLAISGYVAVLAVALRRRFRGTTPVFGLFIPKAIGAVTVGIGAGFACRVALFSAGLEGGDLLQSLARGALAGAAGLIAYGLAASALHMHELDAVLHMVTRRLRRRSPGG